MHRAHLRCGLYNNVFFVACLPYCVGTDPLSASPLSLPRFPSPFEKKDPLVRVFSFSRPRTSAVIAYLEIQRVLALNWFITMVIYEKRLFVRRCPRLLSPDCLSPPFSPIFRFPSLSLSLFVLYFPQFFIEDMSVWLN